MTNLINAVNTPRPVGQNCSQLYGVDSGSANAYVVTLSPIPAAITAGQVLNVFITNSNTGASTINVNSIGAKAIKKFGATALVANDLIANQVYTFVYDGTNFQLMNWSSYLSGMTAVTIGNITISGDGITDPNGLNMSAIAAPRLSVTSGGALYLYEATNTYSTTFNATAQVSNANYTMPPAFPGGNGYTVSCTTAGVWTWVQPAAVISYVNQASTPVTVANNTIYYVNDGATQVVFDIPATAAFGFIFTVVGGSAGGWKIQANTGQTINIGVNSSSSAGTATNSLASDNVTLMCTTANTTFTSVGAPQGTITLA